MTIFFSHKPQILKFPLFFNTYPPYFDKIILPPTFKNFSLFSANLRIFYILYVFFVPPTFTMVHLCITQCTYWTPLRTERLTDKRTNAAHSGALNIFE